MAMALLFVLPGALIVTDEELLTFVIAMLFLSP
jgi:hypothetical protein